MFIVEANTNRIGTCKKVGFFLGGTLWIHVKGFFFFFFFFFFFLWGGGGTIYIYISIIGGLWGFFFGIQNLPKTTISEDCILIHSALGFGV